MTLTQIKWISIMVITAVLLSFSLVLAGTNTLPRSLVSSGGGIVSQNGVTLHSALGQPAIGTVANGQLLCSGYLCESSAPPISNNLSSIYLPYISR